MYPLRESHLESRICYYARSKKIKTFKLTSPPIGVPDRIFINEHGFIFFVEFKSEKGYVSSVQKNMISDLNNANCFVYVVNNLSQGYKILKHNINIKPTYDVKPY